MKIAISSEGPGLDAQVDPRFGRAAGFVVLDTQTRQTTYLDNGASQAAAQGAGIQTAERLANAGVQAVLSGFVGPKAFTALQAAGVAVFQELDKGSVGEAVALYESGKAAQAQAPNRAAGGRA